MILQEILLRLCNFNKKAGALSENIFFFSPVNLLDHVEVIKSLGYDVSLCKIEYEP